MLGAEIPTLRNGATFSFCFRRRRGECSAFKTPGYFNGCILRCAGRLAGRSIRWGLPMITTPESICLCQVTRILNLDEIPSFVMSEVGHSILGTNNSLLWSDSHSLHSCPMLDSHFACLVSLRICFFEDGRPRSLRVDRLSTHGSMPC